MSTYNTDTRPSAVPSRFGVSQKVSEAKAKYASGDWINIGYLAVVAIVAALIVTVFTYYLITDEFAVTEGGTRHGYFEDLTWVGTGSGLLLLLITLGFAAVAGTTLGLGFKGKGGSMAAAAAVAVVVSIVVYWSLDAAVHERAAQIVGWSLVAIVAGAGLAFWGWKSAKELAEDETGAEKTAAEGRAQTAMYMFIATLVLALIYALAMWKIYDRISQIVSGDIVLAIP